MDKPKTFWDTFTGAYQMGEQIHRMYLLNLLKDKGVEYILDVGCGTGPIYEIIKNHDEFNFMYKGTDYSQGMIEVCKKLFPEAVWEVEDARHLSEQDNSWDCVLLLHSLDHLDDYKAAIKEAARVARKYVCIVIWRGFVKDGTRLNDRNMYYKKEGEAPWEDTYLQEYSRETLENEFKNNGLFIEHFTNGREVNNPGTYNSLWLLKI